MKTVGYGTYGKVKLAINKETRQKVAVKQLKITKDVQSQLF